MNIPEEKRKAMTKRFADFTEKSSVACLAVGVFQGVNLGIWLGLALFVISMVISYLEA